MKKYISYMLFAVLSLAFMASCTDYLSIPVEADKTDEDVLVIIIIFRDMLINCICIYLILFS